MAGNDWKDRLGVVFSTNPDFSYQSEKKPEVQETEPPSRQKLRVMLDRKSRAGKTVTLVRGFKGGEDDLKELGKFLKLKCGTGGAIKDGEIVIQGDFKEKVITLLKEKGYTDTKPAG